MREPIFITKSTSIGEADKFLSLAPIVVEEDLPIYQIAQRVAEHPGTRLIAVVDQDQKLVGVISVTALCELVFFHVLPEDFFADVTDYEKLEEFAKRARVHVAKDLMHRPVWVTRDDLVKDAFERMHVARLEGLPIVDEGKRVIGYIDMLELLLVWLRAEKAYRDVDDS
ncbi:MAG: CBS domain-containing protein [Chloroflexi bacterium]|nr:CBS domain-containing protein [Chloroflexota bacterium]MCL5075020.1 CBS domain-containing protein [Chloroflexota bacterium]